MEVLAYYGQESHTSTWQGVTIYPRRWDPIGRDALELHMNFNRPDIFVMLFDIWVAVEGSGDCWVAKCHPYSTCWVPIDHTPIPHLILLGLKQAYKPVAMAKFGYDMMRESGLDPLYIPHGVDTEVFKPLDKIECRRKHNIPEDAFVVGINAANKGPRKHFPEMLAAFQEAAMEIGGPDKIRLYMNTDLRFPEGMDLPHIIQKHGLGDFLIYTHPYARYVGIPDSNVAEMYNTLDVFMNIAGGEGFGLPILEAQACGTPVIATNFSSMIELVDGHGWLVDPAAWNMTGLCSYQAIPNMNQARDAILEAYHDEKKRRQYGAASLEFAKNYDYEKCILPLWDDYLRETWEIIGRGKGKPEGSPT